MGLAGLRSGQYQETNMTTLATEERPAADLAPNMDELLYEVVDGQRVELLPMSVYEVDITGRLFVFLSNLLQTNGVGRAVMEALFLLPNIKRQRRPDVAFVSYQRWPRERRVPRSEAWPIAPDLAVEVVSRTDGARELMNKVQEYFRAGVQQVWVVWPDINQIQVWESATQIRVLSAADVLHGEPLLPGFQLPVAALFEPAEETN